MSNNIGRTEVAADQNQKEVTINDSDGRIDAALTEVRIDDYVSGNITLTASQFQQAVTFETLNLTVARDLTVTATKKLFVVDNTAGTAALTVKIGTGSVAVPTTETRLCYTDGTANGIIEVGAAGAGGANPYDVGMFLPGVPTNSQLLLQYVFVRAVDFPDEFVGSKGLVGTNPTAAATIDVKKNGTSIGTISITTGGVVTFVTAGAGVENFVAGDKLELIAQASADATLADISITFNGTRI